MVGLIASLHQLKPPRVVYNLLGEKIAGHRSSPLKGIQRAVLLYGADTEPGKWCRRTMVP